MNEDRLPGGFLKDLPEPRKRLGRMTADAALREVGYPNAVDITAGRLIDLTVPPRVAHRAWALAVMAAGEEPCSFDEWRPLINDDFVDRPDQLAMWDNYFALHEDKS